MNQNDPHVAHKEPHMAHKEPHVDQESEPHVALCEPRVDQSEPHVDCNEPHVDRREPDEIFFLQCRHFSSQRARWASQIAYLICLLILNGLWGTKRIH